VKNSPNTQSKAKRRSRKPQHRPTEAKDFLQMLAQRMGEGELIEISWTNEEGGLPYAQLFGRGEIDQAVALAMKWNKQRRNIYVGGAPRDAGTRANRRAKDEHCTESHFAWADFDDRGAFKFAMKRARALRIMPNRTIITGKHPHLRAQCWWRLKSALAAPDLQRLNAALQVALKGDPTVTNISRLMRLPGCIGWPLKKGRVRDEAVVESKAIARHDKAYGPKVLQKRLGSSNQNDADYQRLTGARRSTSKAAASAALRYECGLVRSAPELHRNSTLNTAAFNLGQLVGAGALERGEVEASLTDVALAVGLEPSEIPTTIKSGVDAGIRTPRRESAAIACDLPEGFTEKGGQIYREIGGDKTAFLCTHVRVFALTRDAQNLQWGRAIELRDPDGNVHRTAVPASVIGTDAMRAALSDRGLIVSAKSGSKEAFTQLLLQWMPAARMNVVNTLGWATDACDAFVLGDGRVLGNPDYIFQSDSDPPQAEHMRARRSLRSWRSNVAKLCEGNPLLVLAVSAALAGPLLEMVGAESGGIHFRGESTKGKTTLLRAGTSVWGSRRFMQSWRGTDNGLEGLAAVTNGTLLALDEIGMVDPKVAGHVIYMLANGVSKVRATKTGEARRRRVWNVMFLSSGEITLAQVLAASGNSKAGQEVRLLDVPIHVTRGAFDALHGHRSARRFSRAVRRGTFKSYGTAGPAFVEFLIGKKALVETALKQCTVRLRAALKKRYPSLGAQAERGLDRFALVAAAGELATEAGITGWPKGTATSAAINAAKAWMKSRGGSAATEERQAIQNTRSFLSQHGASRFVREGQTRDISDRAGWYKDGKFYILEDAWNYMHRGNDPKRAVAYCKAAGFLLTDPDGKHLKRKAPISGTRCYCIDESIIGDRRAST